MLRVNESKLRKGTYYEYESLDGKYIITRHELSDGMYWVVGEACEGGYGVKEWFNQFNHLWQVRQYLFELGS
jgi:hypothetical protein